MINGMLNARYFQQHLDDYLEDAANDRNAGKPAGEFMIKGYVLDAEEASDDAVIGIVDQRFRRARNLAA